MRTPKAFIGAGLLIGVAAEAQVQPTWESLAEHDRVPEWFGDGELGVWHHWRIPSVADERRPNDGSPYGCRMYSPPPAGKPVAQLSMKEILTKWHIEHPGPSDALTIKLPKTLPRKNVNGFRIQRES